MVSNKEFVGYKFNDWEVIDWVISEKKEVEWICRCKCGRIKQHKVDNIKNGRSRMCKECAINKRRKPKEESKPRILKIRFNNHLNWTEDNTFIGTYAEFLEECKRRREREKEERKKRIKEELESYIGQKYGRLTVIEVLKEKKGDMRWRCKCDCGNEYTNKSKYIKNGRFISCGCISKELQENAIVHKRVYGVYCSMIDRCYNPKNANYKNYGGRGIKICDEWRENSRKFIEWAENNGYDERAEFGKCTIDRIDVNGNYEPSNCRWVDMKVQANNKREYKNAKKYLIYGKEMKLKEIKEEYGISPQLYEYRISRGMSNEEAIEIERKLGKRYDRR